MLSRGWLWILSQNKMRMTAALKDVVEVALQQSGRLVTYSRGPSLGVGLTKLCVAGRCTWSAQAWCCGSRLLSDVLGPLSYVLSFVSWQISPRRCVAYLVGLPPPFGLAARAS